MLALFLFSFASPYYNKIRASEFNHFRIGMAGELCSNQSINQSITLMSPAGNAASP